MIIDKKHDQRKIEAGARCPEDDFRKANFVENEFEVRGFLACKSSKKLWHDATKTKIYSSRSARLTGHYGLSPQHEMVVY